MFTIEAFMEIFNAISAVIIIFFCGFLLVNIRKLNRDLLRARLFFNDAMMQRTWMYISITGASFALNVLVKLLSQHSFMKKIITDYFMIEVTQIIFLLAFIYAVYNCFLVLNLHPSYDQSRKKV